MCTTQTGSNTTSAFRLPLSTGQWTELSLQLPYLDGALLDEAGVCFEAGSRASGDDCSVYLDDFFWEGEAAFRLDPAKEREEVWPGLHREVSQFTRLKGMFYLEGGKYSLSCSDTGEAYTGGWNWKNYRAEFAVTPVTGKTHLVLARVQGGMRSYAFGLLPNDEIGLIKKDGTDTVVCRAPFHWEHGREYRLFLQVDGAEITCGIAGGDVLRYLDKTGPYLYGCVGLAVRGGSRLLCREMILQGKNAPSFRKP